MNNINTKKVLSLFLISIAVIAISIYIKEKTSPNNNQTLSSETIVVEGEETEEIIDNILNEFAKEVNILDTDNDGVQNWEEKIWGTDPSSPDSDQDGISDYQEIQNLKQSYQNQITDSATKFIEEYSNNSKTSQFALDMYSTYALAYNNQLSTENLNAKLSDEIKEIYKEYTNKVSVKDIKIKNNPSDEYYTELYWAITKILSNLEESTDPYVISSALSSDDYQNKLEELQANIDARISELLSMHITPNIESDYINLINSLNEMSSALQYIIDQSDPIISLSFMINIDSIIINTNKTILDFINLLKKDMQNRF